MVEPSNQPVIVAGVLPEQPLWVLQVAGEYARSFGASLVCVSVDQAFSALQGLADSSFVSAPVALGDSEEGPALPEDWLRQVTDLLRPTGVQWQLRQLVGEPSAELARVADEVNALMIIVGARPPKLRGTLRHFVSGSVALRLAHRQYRPVVVVPVEPSTAGERLPWESRESESLASDS